MEKDIYIKYFSHDVNSRHDPKIKNMLFYFRKESQEKAQAAVCIYWWIIEDMHQESYKISDLEAYADDYRCDVEFLKTILDKFDLFRIENDCYISNRVLRNIQEQSEKTQKAKEAVSKRWKNHKKPEEEINIDVDSIIEIFNKEFDKDQIVGNDTKKKITKITKENNLTLDTWQKIFSNAQRGWIIDGKNKKPSLKTILDDWDSFASDDYYLAPDLRKLTEEYQARKEAEQQRQAQETADSDAFREQKENDRLTVQDRQTAIDFINKYYGTFKENLLSITSDFQKFSKTYNFSAIDVIKAREE